MITSWIDREYQIINRSQAKHRLGRNSISMSKFCLNTPLHLTNRNMFNRMLRSNLYILEILEWGKEIYQKMGIGDPGTSEYIGKICRLIMEKSIKNRRLKIISHNKSKSSKA